MKKRSLIIVLGNVVAFIIGCRCNQEVRTMMSLSTQTQWFDFSQNQKRGVVGFHTGLVSYHGVNDISDMNLSNQGVGISYATSGVYADFLYVSPIHATYAGIAFNLAELQ